jgi:hypothetical protein
MEKNNLAPTQDGVDPVKEMMEEDGNKISPRNDAINAESEIKDQPPEDHSPEGSEMPSDLTLGNPLCPKIQKTNRRKYSAAGDPKSNAHASSGRHVGNEAKRRGRD